MSNAINEIDNTDLVFVFGYNPADSHPIVANHVINAKRNGAKIIVCDPRKIETARIADMHIALKNGSNIALLNAMGHVIIEENLYDKAFVASRTEGFEEYRKIVEGYTPESVEDITGVSASEIRQAARMYAQAKSAAILWGMGVTQFYQGVETVRSLTSLAMLTGNLGKPHAGVNPVRGQNNVQGACDMGALPDTYPGYQYVKDPANREKFAKAWGVESLPAHTGYRISELPHRAAHGEVRAAYIMGEDPLQTDAELSAVRKAFEDLELVIVQDIFMTKTASAADVILPSTSWGEHEGVFSVKSPPVWVIRCTTTTPRRSGMSCVICARISTVRLTRKWANWASFSGLAAILQMPIRGLLICLKRSLIPRTVWRSSSPATG
ncbi:formate dehydrogenase-H, selenopolypeptide subunit [Shigella sonnei]|nr:formate dehydrogenase-H%2C selenopolypeptide subunit [Shigella sonnei]SJA31400.1 formate dehydrogenase-H, selenopolypeptide subunit [Shigella sonnei]SJA33819.1 formate dehydrogenase-H, selenopolypeptide subunit [Shigella sonnei]SJA42686.1 formate dehydrogenase-H, selenopolypeptide subunit [Shigella sonnei]SJA44729.1 formate dehydrogenase-H, selenopolypeptide subunit [Shigella sonnei]